MSDYMFKAAVMAGLGIIIQITIRNINDLSIFEVLIYNISMVVMAVLGLRYCFNMLKENKNE